MIVSRCFNVPNLFCTTSCQALRFQESGATCRNDIAAQLLNYPAANFQVNVGHSSEKSPRSTIDWFLCIVLREAHELRHFHHSLDWYILVTQSWSTRQQYDNNNRNIVCVAWEPLAIPSKSASMRCNGWQNLKLSQDLGTSRAGGKNRNVCVFKIPLGSYQILGQVRGSVIQDAGMPLTFVLQ